MGDTAYASQENRYRQGVQRVLSLMRKVRNLFAIAVGPYRKPDSQRREAFEAAKALWVEAARTLLPKI